MSARHCAFVFAVGWEAAKADPLVTPVAVSAIAARTPILHLILLKTSPPVQAIPARQLHSRQFG
jgi:hypothetical protein